MLETSFFIAWIIFGSFAEAAGLDPIANLCSRWYHQSQVKNNVLFIDGGIASFSQRQQYANPEAHDDRLNYTGPITVGTNNYLIVVDMSTSWDWKTNISETAINKTVASGTSNYVPRVQSGVLYHGMPTDDQVYLYGGVTPDINTSFTNWQAPTTNQYTLWGLNTKTQGWTQYDVSLNVPDRPSWGAFAEVPEHGIAFYLNGLVSNMSSAADYSSDAPTIELEGMVVLDLQNHTATNISGDSTIDGKPRTRGGMVYIPQVGNMGVLVSLGGATGFDDSLQLVNMSQINIFDVETVTGSNSTGIDNGWSTQVITAGKLPEPRVDFCLIVVPAPDNSSFNIHMYGGWDPIQDKAYDDIWVLSIPSFEWIQVYTGVLPRFAHTCHLVGNRQMLTVGGTNSTNVTAARCDWEWMGVAILDLTMMAWGSVFDSDKPQYQVNSIISAVIGGGLDGGATKLIPDGGWTSKAVATLFTGSTNQTAPYTPAGNNSSSDGSGGGSSGSKANVGAIAGGVVGGVAGAVLIVGLLIWWYRRRAASGTVRRGPSELDAVQSQLPAEIHGQPVFTELYGSQVPQEPVELGVDEPRYSKQEQSNPEPGAR